MMDGSSRQLLGSCQGKAGEGPSGTHVRRGVRSPQGRVGVWERAGSYLLQLLSFPGGACRGEDEGGSGG